MQVAKIESTYQPNFTAINSSAVDNILKSKRLIGFTTGRPEEYRSLVRDQKENPLSIVLEKGLFKSLKAKIVNENGDVVWKYKESAFDGLRNVNPNKFIKKMCVMAEFFNNSPKCAQRWIGINKSQQKRFKLFYA